MLDKPRIFVQKVRNNIHNLQYAGDSNLLAENKAILQHLAIRLKKKILEGLQRVSILLVVTNFSISLKEIVIPALIYQG